MTSPDTQGEKITSLLVDVKDSESYAVQATDDEPITCFTENGEMALIKWYRKGNSTYNSKYVISVTYG